MRFKFALFFAALFLFLACENKKSSQTENSGTSFFDKGGMDTTVSPGEDFFLYANGKWLRETRIPASEAGWGLVLHLVRRKSKGIKENIGRSIVRRRG